MADVLSRTLATQRYPGYCQPYSVRVQIYPRHMDVSYLALPTCHSLQSSDKRAVVEELPRSDRPVGMYGEILLQEGPAHCGQYHP